MNAGRVSLISTSVAVPGPLFVPTTVYVRLLPYSMGRANPTLTSRSEFACTAFGLICSVPPPAIGTPVALSATLVWREAPGHARAPAHPLPSAFGRESSRPQYKRVRPSLGADAADVKLTST